MQKVHTTLLRVGLIGLVIGVAVVGLSTWAWRRHAHRRRQADREFRRVYCARLVKAMRDYYIVNRSLPADWEEFAKSGAYMLAPDDFDRMVELGHNDTPGDNPFAGFQEEMFRHALAASRGRVAAWDDEIRDGERPLRDLEGDLDAQLGLFLDPGFDASFAASFLEKLRDERGVEEATLSAFVQANTKLCVAHALVRHPERAMDHPDFVPITKARAQAELRDARAELLRLKGEILAQAGKKGDGSMARYFVMHLTERDLRERGRPLSEKHFEIQLLDAQGRAKACAYVGSDETTSAVEGEAIPAAVLEAARRQPPGQGDYVDECGNSVPPF